MADYYPPVGFHFKVVFGGFDDDLDVRFQEVAGLSAEVGLETLEEGGENRFTHNLPSRTKFTNLVLKRGLVADSGLVTWIRDAVENLDFKPVNLTVSLLNRNHEPLTTWNLVNAYPVKWSVGDFKAQENALAVETLEIAYHYFTRL